MGKSRYALLNAPARTAWRDRALGAVRPGVEAMLLASVALGCAQAGWSVFASQSAGASSAAPPDDRAAPPSLADVRSPFSPLAADADGAQAAVALVASMKLSGVRMAPDPSLSGAVLTLDDGAQHAFAVGDEIAPGVTLSDVRAGSVLVSFQNGQQELALAGGPPSFSFARAMLGEVAAPAAAAQVAALISPEAHQAHAAALQLTPDDARALAVAFAGVSVEQGEANGWRLPANVPAIVTAAGLQPGDLVLAVNGAGPQAGALALGALQQGDVTLTVKRGAGAPFTVTLNSAEPT